MTDRIEQILAAVDSHEAVDPTFREGWHAAVSAIRVRLTEPDRIEKAIALAREDGEDLKRILAAMESDPSFYIAVDGSMYAPSWRALAGGAEVYDVWSDPEGCNGDLDLAANVVQVYSDELDRLTNELGLSWEDGCLRRAEEEDDPE